MLGVGNEEFGETWAVSGERTDGTQEASDHRSMGNVPL